MTCSVFFAAALLFSIVCSAQTVSTRGWSRFVDTAGKFTASYPPEWTNKIKAGNRVFFTSPAENAADNFYENINISVTQDPSFGTTLKIQDAVPNVLEQLQKALIEFKLETQKEFKWNGNDAVEIVYTGKNKNMDDDTRVRLVQWFCFYKKRLYVLTYTEEANNKTYSATARAIMNSIIFK